MSLGDKNVVECRSEKRSHKDDFKFSDSTIEIQHFPNLSNYYRIAGVFHFIWKEFTQNLRISYLKTIRSKYGLSISANKKSAHSKRSKVGTFEFRIRT